MHILTKVAIGFVLYQWLKPASPAAAGDIAADAEALKTNLTAAANKVSAAVSATGVELPPAVQSMVDTAVSALKSAADHADRIASQMGVPESITGTPASITGTPATQAFAAAQTAQTSAGPVIDVSPSPAGSVDTAGNPVHFYPVGQPYGYPPRS